MLHRKTNAFIAAAFILLFTLGSTAFAQSSTAGETQEGQRGCKMVEERIKEKVERFNQLKRSHVTAYNNLQDRVKKFIEKLDEKGYETGKLESDLQLLNAKVIKFAKDYGAYINKLAEAQAVACSDAEELKTKIKEAIELLKSVHADAQDIRSFYRTVIRSDLSDIRKQQQ